MPADYRGTIRHARPWVEMCARDMPHLDVHYVTREGKSVLTGMEQAFLESDDAGRDLSFRRSHELLSTLAGAGARFIMDGHGGDYTLAPARAGGPGAPPARAFQFRRFVAELRGHLRLTGALGSGPRSSATSSRCCSRVGLTALWNATAARPVAALG